MVNGEAKLRKPFGPLSFLFLSVLVGVIAGLGAVLFRGLIALFHNLFFLGTVSTVYNANIHTPASPWGPFVILVPVVGALGVVFLIKNFAPEAKGHGVPEVMDAIHYQKGFIRPVVAVIKSLASALSIGSGGSIGREGPIIQIGSAFGSTLGQLLRMSPYERIILIAAGAGGGIAATFNTPVGGMLFAVELLLQEVSVKTLVPVAVSTVVATYIGQFFFGAHPSFVIPEFETPYFQIANPVVLLTYVGLGAIMGLASTLCIKSIYFFEDYFELRLKCGQYTRHLLGMFVVGLIIYLSMTLFGQYYIEGVGYSTIQEVLSGMQMPFYLLLVLFLLKLLATSLTLGSGGSGGIFSPSLFLGATLGCAYGVVMAVLFPHLSISPPAFAVAGMAGMVGGVTGAAMTSIVMIFEMTLDYSVILPITITVAISYGVRKLLSRESIYTEKLVRRGHLIPDSLRASLLQVKMARDIMDTRFKIVSASLSLEELVGRGYMKNTEIRYFLVEEAGGIVGVATRRMVLSYLKHRRETISLRELARDDYLVMTENATILRLFYGIFSHEISFVLVLSEGMVATDKNVRGLITKERLAEFVSEAAEQFPP
ncbi:MAG: chloride channel protein [Geobacteraceae bacterium]